MSEAATKLNLPDISKIPGHVSKAIVNAFGVQLSCKVSAVKMSLDHSTLDKYSIDCVSTLAMRSSTVLGLLCLGFPKATFLGVVEKMIGEKAEAVTSDNSDASSEILNIVFSSARKPINEDGFDFDPAIPTTLIGSNLSLAKSNLTGQSLFFECTSEIGPFLVVLALKHKGPNDR